MKFTSRLFIAILSVCLTACIDNYDPKLTGGKPKIVFEGILTDQAIPQYFQLSFSAGYNSKESVFDKFVNAAKVWITDEKNVRIDLIDLNKGQFSTPEGFRGQVGKTYQVHIQLSDGTSYASKAETMRYSPPIDKVYTEFKLTTTLQPKYRGNFNVYLDVKDPATEGDFYRWKWSHYEKANFCAAYVVNGEGSLSYKKCCGDCWNVNTCLGCIILASDNFVNGKTLPRQYIAQIPFDNITSYYMLIEQMSLSREAYNFWKSVDEQANNSGGIFDTAPATIRGNIKNVNDETDGMLGYFQVSAVTQKVVYIQRNNIGIIPFGFYVGGNYNYLSECEECKESPYRTAKRPLNWID
ncbi:DUF4249 domain-containing protein [Emticicia sp. SJ17W-69]|uniref:DUF4249 domain-containing protein n=1 Tax=Emticicia sp. SJ17W-69 TaxID=3421657 RepID=UPI003EBF6629